MGNLRKVLLGVALCASMAAASAAHAGVLFSDNFDAENGGVTALNYAGFANWTVSGQVDLVRQPDYGIACNGGSCVDLDGSSGPGGITSPWIAFGAGQHVTVSFDLSGNQRDGNSDEFDFFASFLAPTDLYGLHAQGGFGPYGPADNFGVTGIGYGDGIAGAMGWTTYSFDFVAGQAGSLQLNFSTTSGDNVGPLVDNVLVSAGGVPEPAAWALMIGGFGLAGAALRRQRRAAVGAAQA